MIYKVKFTTSFKKDLKLVKKQNKDLNKLYKVIDELSMGNKLDANIKITNLQVTIRV